MAEQHAHIDPDEIVEELLELSQRIRELEHRKRSLESIIVMQTNNETKLGSDRTVQYGYSKIKVRRPLNVSVDVQAAHEALEAVRVRSPSLAAEAAAAIRFRQSASVNNQVWDWLKENHPNIYQMLAGAVTERPGQPKVEVLT